MEKARKRSIRHTKVEGGRYEAKGAGRNGKSEGDGAGLDEKVQGMGAGLDKMVQAGTKPIVILKTESEETKNSNIHTKIVIPKAEYEDGKELVKEHNAKRNKDEGAARSIRAR